MAWSKPTRALFVILKHFCDSDIREINDGIFCQTISDTDIVSEIMTDTICERGGKSMMEMVEVESNM